MLGTTKSIAPSPFISTASKLRGFTPTFTVELSVNIPAPLFLKIETVPEEEFVTAKSIAPSPSKSAALIPTGVDNPVTVELSVNDPLPSFFNIEILFEP